MKEVKLTIPDNWSDITIETYRDNDSFSDVVRGLHLYGRKLLRPEAIVTAAYNLHS